MEKDMKDALLAYDYAAFQMLDFIENAAHSIDVTPALKARLDLLRVARDEGKPFLTSEETLGARHSVLAGANDTESKDGK